MCRDAPTGAIALNFGMRGKITDAITHTKFYVNRFSGFGVLTPPILPFSTGLAGRPYNSVSPTVLHCDAVVATATQHGGTVGGCSVSLCAHARLSLLHADWLAGCLGEYKRRERRGAARFTCGWRPGKTT